MAIYHCHCKIISRGSGRSVVGASAYRSAEKIKNLYDGMIHDYTKKSGVVYKEVFLCDYAPERYKERSVLWNEVEKFEKSKNAQLSREYEIALPKEFGLDEQIQVVKDFTIENFVKNGMCADVVIHDKKDGNPHAHILLTLRQIKENGEWDSKAINEYVLDEKGDKILQKIDKNNRKIYKRIKIDKTNWNTKEFLQQSRKSLADIINKKLEEKNIEQRVDHRSYKEQGINKIATIHLGVSANAMKKRNIESHRESENKNIIEINKKIKEVELDIIALKLDSIKKRYVIDYLKYKERKIIENKVKENSINVSRLKKSVEGKEKTKESLLKEYNSVSIFKIKEKKEIRERIEKIEQAIKSNLDEIKEIELEFNKDFNQTLHDNDLIRSEKNIKDKILQIVKNLDEDSKHKILSNLVLYEKSGDNINVIKDEVDAQKKFEDIIKKLTKKIVREKEIELEL